MASASAWWVASRMSPAAAGRDAAAAYPPGRYLDRLLAAYSFAVESTRDPHAG